MPTRRYALLFGLVLVLTNSLLAQQTPQKSLKRDPMAISILVRALDAAGGRALLAAVRDYTATGTITYYWGGQGIQGGVTIRSKGIGRMRLDASLEEGTRSTVVNNGSAWVKETNGAITVPPLNGAFVFASPTVPWLQILAALQDSTTGVSYEGLVASGNRQLHNVRVQQNFPQTDASSAMRSVHSRRDFFIDAETLQIVQIHDVSYSRDAGAGAPHDIVFSDYRAVQGAVVPFAMQELVNGQIRTFDIHLQQYQFNTGLADSDFANN